MRIAAISDIHGNLQGLEAVLKAVEEEKPDQLVVLGDLVAFGPNPGEALDRVRDLGDAVILRGNTDRYVFEMESPSAEKIWGAIWWTKNELTDEQARYLKSLRPIDTIELDGVSMCICHADPASDDGGFFPKDEATFPMKIALAKEKVVISGHTHRPLWRHIGNQVLINDGSAGFPYDGDPRPSYAIVDTSRGKVSEVRIERVEYNTEEVSQQLAAIDLPMAQLMSRRVLVGLMNPD